MRLSHVRARVDRQATLIDSIAGAFDNLIKIGTTNITIQRITVRHSALKEQWDKFTLNHEAIDIAITRLDRRDKRKLLEESYFKENLFSVTQECYLEALERMNLLIEQSRGHPSKEASPSLPATMPNTTTYNRARLPKIDLPKFNGTPSEWLSFKDMFQSLVTSNPTLTPVEKLQYLKMSLIGSADHLLKNTSLIADNFQKAWDSLISFYENKRLLVNEALQSLLTMKRMSTESAAEMELIYTTVTQIYRTLETLQRPVHTWDDFLVFITVQRLDPESVKAWEHHLGSSKEVPTWVQFMEFLMTRMLTLKAFEKSQTTKPSSHHQRPSAKSHYSGQMSESDPAPKSNSCTLCSENHYINSCPQYTNKSIPQRLEVVSQYKLCYNCLGHHRASACRSTKRCYICGKKHHSTIHRSNPSSSSAQTAKPTTSPTDPNSSSDPAKLVHYSTPLPQTSAPCILLATAQVTVITKQGRTTVARALIDQGSEISLITERLVQVLHLRRLGSSIPLIGVGAQKSGKTKGMVSFRLKPHFKSDSECSISAHVLQKLTSSIPSADATQVSWPHLKELQLADPSFNSPGLIDIILGADVYGQIIESGIRRGPADGPIAQQTKLGWIVSGPSGLVEPSTQANGYNISIAHDLHDMLQKFWQLEETPSSTRSSISADDQNCEDHFRLSHTRDENGRYTVRLPFKLSVDQLGDSRTHALRMLSRLFNKLQTDPVYHQAYSSFLRDYELLQHMERVPTTEPEPPHVYYLPHHGIIRNNSLTTKLRVVFNGSSRTDTGVSLNDILHTGTKLQVDLLDVLMRFRRFGYVFSTDIEKMYRQIKINSEDWNFQRILWKNERGDLATYQLTTVTYGLACAPFLALRTLLQLVEDEGHRFPLAVPILAKRRYVDDIFGGADSLREAQEQVHQVNQLCMAGGFPLQKWTSNHPQVLHSIPPEKQVSSSSLPIEENTMISTLGLSWKPVTDTFHFTLKPPVTKVITKRTILSAIAQLFDPLGLLSPVIISAKIIMQELWSIKCDWDDPLPDQVIIKWNTFVEQLQQLPSISVPRWLGVDATSQFEIHGFCDASQRAIAATVYIRIITQNEDVKTTLVCSKTKVAPLKRLTIPRLELTGAVLLTKLAAHVIRVLEFETIPIFLWTDSAIVLTWINNHPSRWKDFIHNRVCLVQETLPQANWRYVPGTDNPADCATRGLTSVQLSQHHLWWTGPYWLTQQPSAWPSEPQSTTIGDNLEERPIQAFPVSLDRSEHLFDLIHRYSTLTRLLRITALCRRFISCLRRTPGALSYSHLTPEELDHAKNYWIKEIQHSFFYQELQTLAQGKSLPKSSPLIRLTPFLDSSGFLRVGGRLNASSLSSDAKHQLIIPKDSPLTNLIISDAHSRTLHGGTQATLAFIRNNYWIVGGRLAIRSFVLKCVPCARYRKRRAQQLMGQLPATRITPSRPFLHSGIDYAGPLTLKTWKGRTGRKYKAYIALFVCQSTSAVHLELVTDYTADAFLAAYKRFTSRRGICATLTSDCGTNLRGADVELRNLFSSASKQLKHLASLLANDGTQWKFIPPGAPHFGGQWEAGVKSVKYHLRRVIGEQILTYEEMMTFLTQVEAVLNSRPIGPLTDDPDDFDALTPGHFLIGHAPSIIPEPSLEEIKTSRLSKWQQIRQMIDSFWARWSHECLQRHQAIYKWNQTSARLKEGSLVLVVDERYPPSKWPLGRITQLHPGKDGHTRVVTVCTQTSSFKRPIVKTCPLPVDTDSF